MKIKQNLNHFKKLFEVQLIKSKIYEKTLKKKNLKNFSDLNLHKTAINFKKSLKIIFKYHKRNNKILFLGTPENFIFELKNTNHIMIPLISNLRKINYKTILKNHLKIKNQIVNIKKKPDLIVLFSKNNLNYKLFLEKEFFSNIPMIEFSNNKTKTFSNSCYHVAGNTNFKHNKNVNNLFFSIICNLLTNKNI